MCEHSQGGNGGFAGGRSNRPRPDDAGHGPDPGLVGGVLDADLPVVVAVTSARAPTVITSSATRPFNMFQPSSAVAGSL